MNIISREWKHYNTLSLKTRSLVSSFALRSIAQPLLSLFINSFIWRNTASLWNVAAYNVGFFMFLSVGFYINGLLLKNIKITKLYLIGSIISVISTLALLFFSGTSPWHFLAYGAIFGFGSGLYWSNRNFLTFQETESKQRNYFFSLTTVMGALIALLITFLMGWTIVMGENNNWYTPNMAYWVFGILASISLIASGVVVLKTDYRSPNIGKLLNLHISSRWTKARFINFNMGLLEGIAFFLPTLLILFYLGKEGVLGTINTIVTLFIVTITYIYGRVAKPRHRKPTYFATLLLYIVLSTLLILSGGPLSILIFVLLGSITRTFQWTTIQPALLDIIDDETKNNKDNQYTFIFDEEVFLNMGRVFSVLILFLIIKMTSEQMGLLATPLLLGVTQLILMSMVWNKKVI